MSTNAPEDDVKSGKRSHADFAAQDEDGESGPAKTNPCAPSSGGDTETLGFLTLCRQLLRQ